MCGCDVLMLPLVLPLVLPLALALLGASRAPVRCIEWAGGRAHSPTTVALTTARAQMQGQGAGACRRAARKVQPGEVQNQQGAWLQKFGERHARRSLTAAAGLDGRSVGAGCANQYDG